MRWVKLLSSLSVFKLNMTTLVLIDTIDELLPLASIAGRTCVERFSEWLIAAEKAGLIRRNERMSIGMELSRCTFIDEEPGGAATTS